MTVYGKEIREHLSKEEIVVNLMECVMYLAERDDDVDTITINLEGAKITLHVGFGDVQEE